MRTITKAAALTAFAATMLAAPLAFAGPDEAGENSFWTHQSVAPATTQQSPNERYRATYAAPQAQTQAPAASSQKDPPYFYHAMGTMGEQ